MEIIVYKLLIDHLITYLNNKYEKFCYTLQNVSCITCVTFDTYFSMYFEDEDYGNTEVTLI